MGRVLRSYLLFLSAVSLALPADETVLALTYVDSSSGLEVPGLDGGDTEFEMVDVNLDGHVDLVSVGDHGNPLINSDQSGIMVWFGDGAGNWTHAQSGSLGYGGVAVGDVNGDGLMDVGYGIHHNYSSTDLGDQLLEVALGDGSGLSWTPWDDGLAEDGGQSWGMFTTDFGDLDGDGDLDVGSIGFGASDGMHAYLNQGDGTWKRSFGFLGGNSSHVYVFGDVNGDGLLDVAMAKQEGSVWLGDGEGFFTQADGNLPPKSEYDVRHGPSLGDVDRDGRDDLAYCDADRHPRVWLSGGDGAWTEVTGDLPQTGTCEHTQLQDMNGDGFPDLAMFGRRWLRVYAGDGGTGAWTLEAEFETPHDPGTSSAFTAGGDVDHNGLPDLVVVSDKRVDLFNTRNQLNAYREGTPAAALTARMIHPGPGRVLHAGSVRFIHWAAGVPPGRSSTVDLELSAGGAGGPWSPIAAGLPDNGRHQWTVPAEACSDCRVRITVHAPGGAPDAVQAVGGPFSIVRKPDPLAVVFTSRDRLEWTDARSRPRFHVYRGDWERFLVAGEYVQDPAVEPDAGRFCDLASADLTDGWIPEPGQLVFYLVTGYRLMDDGIDPQTPMTEGTLGQDSAAGTRSGGSGCS